MRRWTTRGGAGMAVGCLVLLAASSSSSGFWNVAEAFQAPGLHPHAAAATGTISPSGRRALAAAPRVAAAAGRRGVTQLFSARTGGPVAGQGQDDPSGYGPELIQDPDATLSPEEWEKKYGEEVDTTVLYDEKVRGMGCRCGGCFQAGGKGDLVSCHPPMPTPPPPRSSPPTPQPLPQTHTHRTWNGGGSTPSALPRTWT